MGVLASGRGSNAEAILAAIDGGWLEMDAAIVVTDRAAAAEDVARRHGVPVRRIERREHPSRAAQSEAIRDALIEAGVDIVALAGYAAILDEIEALGFDVFDRRATVSASKRLRLLVTSAARLWR